MSDYTYRKIITDREGVATGEKILNVPDEVVKQIRAEAINDYDNKLNEKINTDTRLKDTIREIHDNVAKEMYCKGIDDFVEKVELKYLGVNSDELYEKYYPREICEQIKEIAEEVKGRWQRMKCKNRKRCGFYLAFGYCVKSIGENCPDYKAGENNV